MKAWFGWVGIGVGLVTAGLAVGAVKLRNERPIVVVNGEKITRNRFIAEMERAHGAEVLRRLVQERLVMQQAQKKGLLPTPAQIQSEIADLRQSEPDMDRQLRIHGKTMDDLVADMRGRLAMVNLIGADVKLTDAEVKKVWAEHQKQFNRPEGRKVEMVLAKSAEIGDKARRLMSDGIPAEFAAQNSGMALPGGRSQIVVYRGQFPPVLEQQIFSLKPGTVSAVQHVGKTFTVIKVLEQVPAQQKRFEDVKDRLLLATKLRRGKSEGELVQELAKSAKIEYKSDRYKGLADTSLTPSDPRATRLARVP